MSGRGRTARAIAVPLVLTLASCTREAPRPAVAFRDPFLGEVPEVRTASLSVLHFAGFIVRSPDEQRAPTDGLDALELAFWPSGHVVWAESDGKGGFGHRVGRVEPERVRELATLVGDTIASQHDDHGVPVDAGLEQVCARSNGQERVEILFHVFGMRDEAWDGQLPARAYFDEPSLEEALRRDRERWPEKVAFLTAWHAVKDRIRAALPKDGEIVDRAKLATLGLR